MADIPRGFKEVDPSQVRPIDLTRPAVQNPDGTFSTELSITVEAEDLNNGRPTNIPTIVDGKKLSNTDAIISAIQSGLPFNSFDTVEQAEIAAGARSKRIGDLRDNNVGAEIPSGFKEVEGTQKDAIARQFAGPGPTSPSELRATPQPVGGGIIDAFTKGVTFGLQPLITAGESALLGRPPGGGFLDVGDFSGDFQSRFDEALAAERLQNEQFRAERPVTTATVEVGGSLATLIVAPGATLTRFGGKTFAGKTAAATAEGGVIGGGFALGEGRDIGEGIITGAAFGAGGSTLIRGVQNVAGGFANFARGADLMSRSPTLQQLRDKTTRLYTQARGSGIRFKEDAFEKFATDLETEMRKQGARPKLTDKTIAVLEEIKKEVGGTPDFQTMDELRRIAQIAAGAIEPAEQRLGRMIIDQIDAFVESGSSTLGAKAAQARNLWGRVRRDEQIALAIERAKQNVSGLDQGLRVEFRKILNSEKKFRGFTKAEIAAMEQIVRGTKTANTLRAIGKLGFSTSRAVPNVVGGAIGIGAGGAVGGVPGALAVQGAGIGARTGVELLQRRNAQVLGAMVRSGKSQGEITRAAAALERIGDNDRAFQAFVRTAGVLGAGNATQ